MKRKCHAVLVPIDGIYVPNTKIELLGWDTISKTIRDINLKEYHLYILSTIHPVRPKKGDKFLFWGSHNTDVIEYIEDNSWGGIRAVNLNETIEENKVCIYSRGLVSNTIIASTNSKTESPLIPESYITEFCKMDYNTFEKPISDVTTNNSVQEVNIGYCYKNIGGEIIPFIKNNYISIKQ